MEVLRLLVVCLFVPYLDCKLVLFCIGKFRLNMVINVKIYRI